MRYNQKFHLSLTLRGFTCCGAGPPVSDRRRREAMGVRAMYGARPSWKVRTSSRRMRSSASFGSVLITSVSILPA